MHRFSKSHFPGKCLKENAVLCCASPEDFTGKKARARTLASPRSFIIF